MSEKKEEKEPRLLAFKFAKGGTVLCPYCLQKAVLVKADKSGMWYVCKCEAWQQAYAETEKPRDSSK